VSELRLPGESVAWRVRVRPEGSDKDGLVLVTARLVVYDRPDEVAVFVRPGFAKNWRQTIRGGPAAHKHRPVTGWLDGFMSGSWEMYRILTFHSPTDAHQISLSWRDDTGEFNGWYIDLTSPLRRVGCGFEIVENHLDVIVPPDMSSYELKDEHELAWAADHGSYTSGEVESIHLEAHRAVERLRARRSTLEPWIEWSPEPSWPVPTLPSGWDAYDCAEASNVTASSEP
jgi:hypothetical protein